MAPRFLTSLVPRRQQNEQTRPLLQVLASLTWLQWAQFFSGYVLWVLLEHLDSFSHKHRTVG